MRLVFSCFSFWDKAMASTSNILIRPLDGTHLTMKNAVREGDCVVDATMGNGYDTCLLAQLVGERGQVISFDIQEGALVSTRKRLSREGLDDGRVHLHLCSHARLREFVDKPLSAVMFNLGYLPGGNRSCVTVPEETLKALSEACDLLKEGGVMTVMCYTGHEGGAEEGRAVREFFRRLPIKSWLVTEVTQLNGNSEAPFLLIVHKGS